MSAIGNALGEGDELLGRIIGVLAFVLASLIGFMIALATYNFAPWIASVYTKDAASAIVLESALEPLSLVIFLYAQILAL